MKLTRITPDTGTFPKQILPYIEGAELFDSSCHSDAVVIYSSKGYYIKTAKKDSLSREATAGRVFCGIGMGYGVCEYISEENDYLVTKEVPGKDLTHCIDDPEFVCSTLLKAMKKLHETKIDCDFISEAMNVYNSAVPTKTEGEISPVAALCGINSFEDAVNIVKNTPFLLKCDTLIHGDFCLPNVMTDDEENITLIDFAYSGMGDPHIDLYWAVWSLWYNFKDIKWAEKFLSMYGKENYSSDTLRYVAALEVIL